ncbi:MAG: hypothetical protein AAB393_02155, partial [Bacteroidota bacterium]
MNMQGDLFAGTASDGVFRSTDSGMTWLRASNGLPTTEFFSLTTTMSGYIFVGTWERGLYRSSNNGEQWSPVNIGLLNPTVRSLAVNPTNGAVFAGTMGDGLYRSTDNGDHWVRVLRYDPYPYTQVQSVLVTARGYVFAGTVEGGLFRSTNNGQSWTRLQQRASVCVAANQSGVVYAGGSGLYRSTNDGTSWTRIDSAFVSSAIMAVAAGPDNYIAAGCFQGGVYCSTDGGVQWSHGTNGMTNTSMLSLQLSGRTLFAGTWGGLFRASDSCLTWTQTGLPNARVYSLLADGSGSLLVGTGRYGIYRSINDSTSWAWRSLLNRDI